jgi:hypothetical protein
VQVVGHALRISLLSISWACTRIDIASVTEDQLNPLSETVTNKVRTCVLLVPYCWPRKSQAHALSKACVKLFEAASPFLQLKVFFCRSPMFPPLSHLRSPPQAFFVWSDLLVLCSKQLSFTSLESLSVKATDEELNLYCNVLDNILDGRPAFSDPYCGGPRGSRQIREATIRSPTTCSERCQRHMTIFFR